MLVDEYQNRTENILFSTAQKKIDCFYEMFYKHGVLSLKAHLPLFVSLCFLKDLGDSNHTGRETIWTLTILFLLFILSLTWPNKL